MSSAKKEGDFKDFDASKSAPRKGRVMKVMGPMFSGKTHEAILQSLRWLAVGEKVAYVSHSADVRFGERAGEVRGHGGHSLSAPITPAGNSDAGTPGLIGTFKVEDSRLSVHRVRNITAVGGLLDAGGPTVIVIDEAQWFPNLASVVQRISAAGKGVVVCGLDFTAECTPFGEVLALPADETKTLKALCSKCQQPASFTCRIGDLRSGAGAPTMDVGGTEKYMAVCRQHHPWL